LKTLGIAKETLSLESKALDCKVDHLYKLRPIC